MPACMHAAFQCDFHRDRWQIYLWLCNICVCMCATVQQRTKIQQQTWWRHVHWNPAAIYRGNIHLCVSPVLTKHRLALQAVDKHKQRLWHGVVLKVSLTKMSDRLCLSPPLRSSQRDVPFGNAQKKCTQRLFESLFPKPINKHNERTINRPASLRIYDNNQLLTWNVSHVSHPLFRKRRTIGTRLAYTLPFLAFSEASERRHPAAECVQSAAGWWCLSAAASLHTAAGQATTALSHILTRLSHVDSTGITNFYYSATTEATGPKTRHVTATWPTIPIFTQLVHTTA